MSLPSEPTPAKTSLSDFTTLVYGQPKIGKTTFASQFPGALFLATEQGHNALTVSKVDITSWEILLNTCKELVTSKHDFKTVVIDTIDNLHKLCLEHVCTVQKITHPADMDYGKGWALVNNEFERVLRKISQLPYGLVLVSHSKEIEIKTKTRQLNKAVPDLSGKAREIVTGMSDIILFVTIETDKAEDGTITERRVCRTRPSSEYDAGDRTTRLPDPVELNFAAIDAAFKNGGTK